MTDSEKEIVSALNGIRAMIAVLMLIVALNGGLIVNAINKLKP